MTDEMEQAVEAARNATKFRESEEVFFTRILCVVESNEVPGMEGWNVENAASMLRRMKVSDATLAALVGVAREDVIQIIEEELAASIQRWPEFSRDVSSGQVIPAWDGNLKAVAFAVADAVLALPKHTGQPQEGRDAKDFAIEFAEYLAKDVERFLDFLNTTGIAAGKPASDQSAMTDHWRGLQSAVYEFRKRATKAAAPASPQRAEGERERETPVVPPIGQEK